MTISFLNTYTFDPFENLAVEAALLERVGADDICLYLWQNSHTVVIGKNQNPWKECRVSELENEGGRLARRSSGGGAVYHDLGNLNFSFVASKSVYDLTRQLGVLTAACQSVGIDAAFSGRNDILAGGRKVSGNAFQHDRKASLQHGTLLVSVDLANLARYLVPSSEKMRSKGIDSVRSRVGNLDEMAPGLTIADMRSALERAFEREYGGADVLTPADLPSERVRALTERFSAWEWNFGETMPFDVAFETRFSWGEITLRFRLKGARVAAVKAYSDAMDVTLCESLETALNGANYGPELADALQGRGSEHFDEIATWLKQNT